MENVGLSMDGSQVVAVQDLGLDYNVFELLTKGLSVDNIRLNKPVVYLRREGDTWSLSRLVKKQESEADRSGPEKPIAIDTIGITDGSIVVESPVATTGVEVPKRIDHLDARLSFKYEPVRYSIEITQVSFRGSEPALALNALSGGIAVKDDTLFVQKLALRTPETSLSFDGAIQNYLTGPSFVSASARTSCRCLKSRGSCRRCPASVFSRRSTSRPTARWIALRRDARAVDCGDGERNTRCRSRGARAGRSRAISRCATSISRR
jgi:Uncharacterized protein involved in outer membrane biogenesis